MKKPVFSFLLMLAFCLFTAAFSYADDVMVPFPTAGDMYCSATNGCGTLPAGGVTASMWTAGDYVMSSNFTSTGLTSVTGLSWDFQILNHLEGNNELVDILLNNTVVGNFTAMDSNNCGCMQTITGSMNFGAIGPMNGGYTLEMELTQTIPPGGGSIAFADGGEFTLEGSSSTSTGTTPEPGSILLFGTGALALGAVVRRKMKA
ncbi:MAG: PEP-CTERM sorting domain-containing protein [Candidatus Korobacteraceae bacterium]